MAGRDAGPYHNVVAAGLRARHAYSHEAELALIKLEGEIVVSSTTLD